MVEPEDVKLLKKLRRQIIETAHRSGSGHVPSALSILEPVLAVHREWSVNPGGLDTFVLSKGHASLALYVVLAQQGVISESDLYNFCQFDGSLGGHPDSTKVPGVSASTGSLGHGYPIAAGIAYAKKKLSGGGKVFALLGDGECNEGSIWETALLVSHHNLDNLVTWIDFNHSGDRALGLGDLGAKWSAFGFDVVEIDGHDYKGVVEVISKSTEAPLAIIAHTVKGFGVPFMHGSPEWHHTVLDKDAFDNAMAALA